jgi:hypothetical protein
MKNQLLLLGLAGALALPISADIYIYNTTDERMTYQVVLPNGDTKDGVIGEDRGYGPEQATLTAPDGKLTTFKVMSESGGSNIEFKSPNNRCSIIGNRNGALQMRPVSWCSDNGQNHQRKLTIYNATGAVQTFDLVDEKQMRSLTIQPGDEVTVEAKNGFSGSSGFHHLKFPGGHRLDNAISSGYFTILYNDSRSPGKVQANNYGHLTMPRNTVLK